MRDDKNEDGHSITKHHERKQKKNHNVSSFKKTKIKNN